MPSSLLAFLNTTTWQWTQPANLQPASTSAASFHTSVMTPSGVMVSAFGLGASNQPRSDVFYLDVRGSNSADWAWKSEWTSDMLGAPSASTGSSSNGSTGSSGPTGGNLAAIVVPVVLGVLLLIPISILFIRRHVRAIRKRRLAQYFSFEDQEDSGAFLRPFALLGGRRTKTQYSFGQDANEKEGSIISEAAQGLVSILKRYSTGSKEEKRSSKGSKLNEKEKKWEEIDFGLGKLDEQGRVSRNSSFSATGSPREPGQSQLLAFPVPVTGTSTYEPSPASTLPSIHSEKPTGSPMDDGQHPLVPSLVVMPATPHVSSPLASYPALNPVPATAPRFIDPINAHTAALDWAALQAEMNARPAFRSISPSASIRSQANEAPKRATSINRKPVPYLKSAAPVVAADTPPVLPPLPFESSPTTIPLVTVNPKTGRRTSEASFRSVSQPQPMSTRQLVGSTTRRGSIPSANPIDRPAAFDANARRGSLPSVDGRRTSSGSLNTRRGSGASVASASRLRVVNIAPEDEGEPGQAL